jgi:hypothetical protein
MMYGSVKRCILELLADRQPRLVISLMPELDKLIPSERAIRARDREIRIKTRRLGPVRREKKITLAQKISFGRRTIVAKAISGLASVKRVSAWGARDSRSVQITSAGLAYLDGLNKSRSIAPTAINPSPPALPLEGDNV